MSKTSYQEAHDAACNAIRAIHYMNFTPEAAQAIIATLAEKVRGCPFTERYIIAVELLDDAFIEFDRT